MKGMTMYTEVPYEKLENSNLVIDAIYKGGTKGNISDEPLHLIFFFF